MAAAPARSSRRAPASRSPSHAPQPADTAVVSGSHAPTNPKRSRASSPGAGRARYASPSGSLLLAKHRVLEALGEPELHHALRGDLDGLAGLGVAAHARLAVGEDQTPEAGDDEDVLRLLGREREELIHQLDHLLLGEVGLLGEVADDGGLGHRFGHEGSLRFRGWGLKSAWSSGA